MPILTAETVLTALAEAAPRRRVSAAEKEQWRQEREASHKRWRAQKAKAKARYAASREYGSLGPEERLEALRAKYPRAMALADAATGGTFYSPDYLGTARDPRETLARGVLYTVLADNGPDISYERLGRVTNAIRRKHPGIDLLQTYEDEGDEGILHLLVEAGYVADVGDHTPKTDTLRSDADKYWD